MIQIMHPFCINQRTIKLFQKLYHSSCMRIITIKMKCNNVREFYVFPIHLTHENMGCLAIHNSFPLPVFSLIPLFELHVKFICCFDHTISTCSFLYLFFHYPFTALNLTITLTILFSSFVLQKNGSIRLHHFSVLLYFFFLADSIFSQFLLY